MSPRPLSSPAGTRDIVGADKEAMDRAGSIIGREFLRHGYVLVQPPVIDNVEPFVDRSGEEIRQRMYTFQDPSGRQLCLRPELTIPTCRLYLDKFHSNLDHQRLCYDGLVFRYDPVGPGRYREFRQIGVEYFGNKTSTAADAETVALAYRSIVACGVVDAQVWLNDVELITSALEELGVPPSTRDYIALRFNAPDALDVLRKSVADADEALVASLSRATDSMPGDLENEIAGLRTDGVRQFVRRIMTLTNTKELGSRSIEEIAERMVAKLERHAAGRISHHAEACLRELLAVEGRADEAIERLREIADKYQLSRVGLLVAKLRERLTYLTTIGVPADSVNIRARMKRTLQYYTGFVFEVHAKTLGGASELCGGGRYDHLLRSMGAGHDVPAVGFAIGVDRVCLATGARATSDTSGGSSVRGGVDAILVPAGEEVGAEQCFQIAKLLRDAGWSVEVELEGRRPKNIITKASRRNIPFIVFAGRTEWERGGVNIKRLATHAESFVTFASLARYIADNNIADNAAQLAGDAS
jgi:ATP phosphoribosyltransferase regulatory subunit